MQLKIKNGAIEILGKTILEKINFEVNDGEHIAIVGRNGAGKTTLLRAIINNEMLSKGIEDEDFKISKTGNFKIGFLEQIKINETHSLFDELASSFEELIILEKKIEFLSFNLTNDKNILDYSHSLEQYKFLGGYTYKSEIETMIKEFGFSLNDKNKLLSEFSGGEKMKIAFIKLLLSNPDLLILDEPTNHLDISTIEWLEKYLKNYKKAFIVVSHDRMFLDNVSNIIYDIEYGETIKYHGDYTKYVFLKEERYKKQLKDYEWQQKEIKRLNDIFLRFRYKPTKASMALSKLKQIERMTLIDKPNKSNTKSFSADINNIPKSGKLVLSIKNLEIGYSNSLGKISLEVERGKKIGIIGDNGVGKSTLLKTLSNIIKPYQGFLEYGYNVNSFYFDQNLKFKTNGTILEEFCSEYPNFTNEEARSALGAFMFSGDEVDKKLSVLSGGERVRLLLCKIFIAKPNLIFLDEPTNHLDIIGKEKLENTLKDYKETLIFVSHDRYFIKKIADSLLVFENGVITYYNYGYEEYLKKRESHNNTQEKNVNKKVIINKIDNDKILKKIEREINQIDEKIKQLTKDMYKEENYNDYKKITEINNQINRLKESMNIKEKEWEQLIS